MIWYVGAGPMEQESLWQGSGANWGCLLGVLIGELLGGELWCSCHLCQACDHLGEVMKWTKISCHLCGIGGSWESLQYKPRLTVTCAEIGSIWKRLQCKLRPAASYAVLGALGKGCNAKEESCCLCWAWGHLEKTVMQAKAGHHLYGGSGVT